MSLRCRGAVGTARAALAPPLLPPLPPLTVSTIRFFNSQAGAMSILDAISYINIPQSDLVGGSAPCTVPSLLTGFGGSWWELLSLLGFARSCSLCCLQGGMAGGMEGSMYLNIWRISGEKGKQVMRGGGGLASLGIRMGNSTAAVDVEPLCTSYEELEDAVSKPPPLSAKELLERAKVPRCPEPFRVPCACSCACCHHHHQSVS